MSIVSAFLLPGSPLPYVQPSNPPWGRLADAMGAAGDALLASKPDTIVVYSTAWHAVLDQLWQTRPALKGVHVDENWHEYGDLPFDIHIDTEFANEAVNAANTAGIKSKGVDYDQFPIDTGTIVASNFVNPDNSLPLIIASNNLYHDWDMTETLGQLSAQVAMKLDRRIAVLVVGGLSGSIFRHSIDITKDQIAEKEEDAWNKKMLALIEEKKMEEFYSTCPQYAQEAKVDMGFKHMAFLKGAVGDQLTGGIVHAYEPIYGSGAAVVEFLV
jgi:2-aminophenol/2-amino-5-chlorophenol 1,6-dioxygenase alpha subunit